MKRCDPVTAVTDPYTLTMIADTVRRLSPSHRDPERFQIENSEIERDLGRLAKGVIRP